MAFLHRVGNNADLEATPTHYALRALHVWCQMMTHKLKIRFVSGLGHSLVEANVLLILLTKLVLAWSNGKLMMRKVSHGFLKK